MSKIIYVCKNKLHVSDNEKRKLEKICHELTPDNLSKPVEHQISIDDTTAFAVINFQPTIQVKQNSVLLGCLFESNNLWDKPDTAFPDGSYAIFRETKDYLEVISDAAGTRTIWYYFDDEVFISATSQIAIIMYIESFIFDERVIPWMLSTGSLGPLYAWDKRLKRIPPNSSVILDKTKWELKQHTFSVDFKETDKSKNEHKAELTDAIMQTIGSLKDLDFNEWALPLSGGYDSRGILCFIKLSPQLSADLLTITWGTKIAENRSGNDAKVAKDLANALNVSHCFLHTDKGNEPINEVVDRFLRLGEGRTDQISSYMDGMEIWRIILEDEHINGIIRGDEGFGWLQVSSEMVVRYNVGCALCSDFSNLEGLIDLYGLPKQTLPSQLLKSDSESLATWRDRLYHSYRVPTILAALSDIKLSFIELINPWLSRRILHKVRELPDNLRTGKLLYKEIINVISPDVNYANAAAIAEHDLILRGSPIVSLIRATLNSATAKQIFPQDFLDHILSVIKESNPKQEFFKKEFRKLQKRVPKFIKNSIRDTGFKPHIDGNVLAFRVFIIIRMNEIIMSSIEQEAKVLNENDSFKSHDTI